jgi:hypothetical protein
MKFMFIILMGTVPFYAHALARYFPCRYECKAVNSNETACFAFPKTDLCVYADNAFYAEKALDEIFKGKYNSDSSVYSVEYCYDDTNFEIGYCPYEKMN